MAQAQVTITAVDRTQAAINSAMRSMKTLERTAKVTAKAVNLAFGFLTGTALVSAFGKITEAAKKTEEGRAALENLSKALKDPALVSAANTIVNTLVNGFTAATIQLTKFIKAARSELISIGAVSVSGSAADVSSIIKGQIANKSMLAGQMAFAGQTRNAQILNLEIEALKKQLDISKSIALQEEKIQQAAIAQQVAAEKIVKTKGKEQAFKFDEKITKDLAQLYEAKKSMESPDLFEESFSAMDVRIASSVQNILDEMNAADQIMANFAQSAAQNIQSAFAEFLFDPFKGGLKGMLSSFLDLTRRMLAELAAQQILGAIFGSFAGGTGFMASFAKAITGRASGGPVSKNTPYIVGERGPELFVPGSSGGIVPNNAMMGGGMTVAPVYNIDARGATADLQSALPGILQENNRRIFEELDRRYGVGR
jgi:hypothetical protein